MRKYDFCSTLYFWTENMSFSSKNRPKISKILVNLETYNNYKHKTGSSVLMIKKIKRKYRPNTVFILYIFYYKILFWLKIFDDDKKFAFLNQINHALRPYMFSNVQLVLPRVGCKITILEFLFKMTALYLY